MVGNSLSEKSDCFNAKLSEKSPTGTAIHSEPSKSYCPKKQVVSFIWAVCRSIIPPDLLGTLNTRRTLRRNISKLLRLRRFEKFSLKLSMHKLKASKFPVLSNKHALCYLNSHSEKNKEGENADLGMGCNIIDDTTHVLRRNIFENWILWLFSCFVVPLVRANFYVTESEHGKQEVFYYQQSMWEEFINRGITCFIDQGSHLLNDASVKKVICNRIFGFSRLRFLPKATGVRPLANLNAPSRLNVRPLRNDKYKNFMSVNGVLRELHAVLKSIHLEEPKKLGSSVFDYNDVYRSLCSFLSILKSGSSAMPGLFIVIADVSKAFDSVNHDKLLSVMKDIIFSDNYHLEKLQSVVCGKKALYVRDNIIVGHQDISTRSTESTSAVTVHLSNCVLVNKVYNLSHF